MKRLQTICAVMAMMAILGAVHANAGTIEAEANDGEHTENGSFINSSATTLKVGVGSEPYGDGRNAVINFKLPDLGPVSNPFTSATLTVNLESLTSVDGFSFNVDLYAFPPRPGFNLPVLGTLVYYESDPPDPTLGMTLIQTDLITGGSGAAVGLYSTGAAGSSNLLSYLNAQYAGGSGIGEFVFFRLNPDDDNGSVVESYNLTSADGSIAANRPTITFTTTSVPVIPATIDIKPGSLPNSINPKSKGTIPVAILSTATFDATKEVDKTSLTFGKTGDEESLAKCTKSNEDVNGDGLDDVVCHFNTQDTGFQKGDTEGILKGKTKDGIPIEGKDSVNIVR